MNIAATVFEQASEKMKGGAPFAIVTMTGSRGHAPQDPGAKILVDATGLCAGTVGGGKVEAKAITYAQEMLKAAASTKESVRVQNLTWNLQKDVGMSCGGEVSFFFEVFVPVSWKIVIFGAGHVAQMLVRQCLMLDAQVTCVDSRPEWLSRLPQGEARLTVIRSDDYPKTAESLFSPGQSDPFIICTTKGHDSDLPVLDRVLKIGIPPYLGVIGSDVKAIKIRKDLRDRGHSDWLVSQVRCPMGIEIGNSNSPSEIAFSIVAELIQVRSKQRVLT
ncbi:MAG: XdhC family protein [Bdellovibrionales bacterium]|nr:XdhC family protein [Bdellovibrionales bacterium]